MTSLSGHVPSTTTSFKLLNRPLMPSPYMSLVNSRKRKRDHGHPYLSGNFAPVHNVQPLTPCEYSGSITEEVWGGEYVRNGGNPVTNEDLGRDAHWFDGDGMLSGVAFKRTDGGVQPLFVNQYILTDMYLSSMSSKSLKTPILPSIATLVNPASSLLAIISRIFRTILLVILSQLPGSKQAIKKISVANTGILFHDGRALATCESGPPMRVALPGLETVGWYNGKTSEGEKDGEEGSGFGGDGLLSFMKEWTTAHPRVDPRTGELVLFHSTFAPPYVHYSIIPATFPPAIPQTPLETPSRLLNAPIPGIKSAKMMHDFGVSFDHTIILDLPLSLDPLNLAKNQAVVSYDPRGRSRFGVFPRHQPESVRWFETNPCCIFHTANSWDYRGKSTNDDQITTHVNMLACRLTSAALVYSAGDVAAPQVSSSLPVAAEEEQCRLYYYQFSMDSSFNEIKHQFALSAIPFEFPSIREDRSMSASKYVYGCSTSQGSFGAALGRAVKIDCLVKVDAETLINRGRKNPALTPIIGCVDERTVREVLESSNLDDPVQIFKLPEGHYAQESRFVPRLNGKSEDDGYIVTYVFDESQLDSDGECLPDARSELWIIDAKDMKTIVGKVHLPMRVPYGLHGSYFSEKQVLNQRPIETIRGMTSLEKNQQAHPMWMSVRRSIESFLA
jgi:carotenoid cleavage dioxygenase-like enzyme